jgi:hypothetical protein
LGWLIVPIGLIYLFLLQRGTFFAVRYILYTLPAYLALVAYGIDSLANFIIKLGLKSRNQVFSTGLARWKTLVSEPIRLRHWAGYGFITLALTPLMLAQRQQLSTYYLSDAYEDWRAVGQLLEREAGPDDAVMAVRAESAINWYYPPASAPFGTFWRSEPIWKVINKHQRRWFILSSYSFKRRRVVVYFHQEGQSFGQMLAQVKTFALPQNALTYAVLAEQFKQNGDLETSRTFYRQAIELARTPTQKASYEARLAALPSPQ